MRERKLRSTAERLLRFRGSLIPYTCYIYKIKRKVKNKNTMRICSLSVPRLKHEWNQTVWSVNNLRCGTAATDGVASGTTTIGKGHEDAASRCVATSRIFRTRRAYG